MSNLYGRPIVGIAAAAAVVCLSMGTALAQTGTDRVASRMTPRTPWGDPDLQGTWTNTTTTPLQRPTDLVDKAVLSDEELALRNAAARSNVDRPPPPGQVGGYNSFWLEKGVLDRRTSLIISPPNGRLPALTPGAQQQEADARLDFERDPIQGRAERGPADSWLDLDPLSRCLTRGLPGAMMPGFYNHNYEILQTPGYVVILVEMLHDTRIIPVDGRPHVGPSLRQWLGDSRGHWEGDTLVVETTNFNDKVKERSLVAFSSGQNLRLVERFRRIDKDTIDYQFTVEDSTTFVSPWTASIPMSRLDGEIYEYACHEGNYALPLSLRGARAQERAAEAAAKKESK